ncbi:MAG: EAL domain-containing protein [Marinobacter sp.]|uniref:two-component system response regulator n=1 Tax=Marinobacter sp. TaxID=50741 RepID=UPI00299E1750|nr:EAL domain-containing protein [Marinobacter sp.]MDX1756312.1 EAL domain-containing protein [Marinobacter sp.]
MTDDTLIFVEEDELGQESVATAPVDVWQVLVVDDDPEVHQSTRFALADMEILGAHVQLQFASSAEEAYRYLTTHEEPAVIFLDVVMESSDAGLVLAKRIRNELKLLKTRIILRTGQAGYAPELKVISEYDINDYRVKNELTQVRLITSLTAALRSYEQILRLETSHRGLEQIIEATRDLLSSDGFRQFSFGILTQISGFLNLTRSEGMVVVSIPKEQLAGRAFELNDQTIVAATGRFEGLVARSKQEITSGLQRQLIDRVIASDEHCFGADGTALICHGQHFSLVVYVDTRRPVTEEERDLLRVFCQNIGLMADNMTLIERLNQQAFFDATTLLPNRLSLEQWLDDQRSRLTNHRLLLINIDYFNSFLETLGQEKCAKLIRLYAACLQDGLRGVSEYFAHLGDDTFAAVIPSAIDQGGLASVLNLEVQLTGFSVHVMSTAVTINLGEEALSGTQLLGAAHLFMKDAKRNHRRGLQHYPVSLLENGRRNIRLLRDLVVALRDDQLMMHYQPKWDVSGGRYSGMEALVRWRHPRGHWVSPGEFVPLAETAGLSNDLFQWVLGAVLRDYANMMGRCPEAGPVAINISGAQLHDLSIVDRVTTCAERYGVPTTSLTFEVTESAAVSGGIDGAIELLLRLKATGARIALDDFGTGYSSLSYLARLPVDQLKLDRSFIQKLKEPRGVAIVKSIIDLSASLGLEVVAEGIEEEAEAELLRELRAHSFQGYLYARPMPVAQLAELLEGNA